LLAAKEQRAKKLNARTAHQLTAGQVVRLGGALGGPVHGRRRRCEPWGQRRKGGAIALDDAREYVAGGSAVHEAAAAAASRGGSGGKAGRSPWTMRENTSPAEAPSTKPSPSEKGTLRVST